MMTSDTYFRVLCMLTKSSATCHASHVPPNFKTLPIVSTLSYVTAIDDMYAISNYLLTHIIMHRGEQGDLLAYDNRLS